MENRKLKIAFPLIHEAKHQIAHAAPTAFALAQLYHKVEVVFFVRGINAEKKVRYLAPSNGFPPNCSIRHAGAHSSTQAIERLLGNAIPLERLDVLWRHRHEFCSFDAIVVPEKTTLLLKHLKKNKCPPIIHTRHGAGDRAKSFNRATAGFDFHLLPGRKHEARMLSLGLMKKGHAIIGYPKFDSAPKKSPTLELFSNNRPTVLYTPHFDPKFSSWYRWGPAILRYFAQQQDFNLIFAPHIMLFCRRWHISKHRPWSRIVPAIPKEINDFSNIYIDTGTLESMDMTYTRMADLYLGGVSSQIYEFLSQPRPAVFLNVSGVHWQDNPDFYFWQAGLVVEHLDSLGDTFKSAMNRKAELYPVQKRLFCETFHQGKEPPVIVLRKLLWNF